MNKELKQIFIKLHISILLAGLTGILGKLITLNEGILVWYRTLLSGVIFFIFLCMARKLPKISLQAFIRIARIGALLAAHWLFFYGSINASNVSVGVVCYALIGFFTAILEPLILKSRFSFRELLYSIITLCGVILIFSFDLQFRTGIILGIISSALAALFTVTTKRLGRDYTPNTILLYEMIGGFLFMTCLLPFYSPTHFSLAAILPSQFDILYLLLLSVFCTIVLQMLQIQVLKKISAFTVNLSYNLEPVYSIILAIIIFNEAKELTTAFYFGLILIIFSVLLQMRNARLDNNAELH